MPSPANLKTALVRVGRPAVLLAVPVVAYAGPGDHIRTGDAVITPAVSVGLEHYTNPYHQEAPEQGASATGLTVSPAIEVRLAGDDVDFDLGGKYELRKFLGDEGGSLDRFSDFSLTADLNALKQSTVGIRLHEGVGIRNSPVDADYSAEPFVTQTRNNTTGAIVIRPGPAFEGTVGGLFDIDDYTLVLGAAAGSSRAFNTRMSYGPRAGVAWKFLPKTALALDAEYKMASWSQEALTDPTDGSQFLYPDSALARAMIGMRGRVTEKLTTNLSVGYGTAVFDEASVAGGDPTIAPDAAGLQRLLVDLEARYALSDDDRVAVGFEREVDPSYFTAFAQTNKVYVTGDARFTDRVGVNAEFNVRGEAYRGQVTRNDTVLDAKGMGTYYVQDYASLSLGVNWVQRASTDLQVEYDDIRVAMLGTFTY